eukprot:gnl/Chilomastix_cuspidata/3697.p1 GENE.gnl/Chilomastix_cuspidata/3697~~gnl/Chilomastix_cuspidata/3697.p1  ORF type:complete len:1005 (-),score=325.43 gnl/Chilomastix_cuspidata/3697:767-3781(-)
MSSTRDADDRSAFRSGAYDTDQSSQQLSAFSRSGLEQIIGVPGVFANSPFAEPLAPTRTTQRKKKKKMGRAQSRTTSRPASATRPRSATRPSRPGSRGKFRVIQSPKTARRPPTPRPQSRGAHPQTLVGQYEKLVRVAASRSLHTKAMYHDREAMAEEIIRLKKQCNELTRENKVLRTQTRRLEAQCKGVERDLERALVQRSVLRTARSGPTAPQKHIMKGLQNRVAALENELEGAQAQLKALRESQRAARVAALERNTALFFERSNALSRENASLRARIEAYTAENARLRHARERRRAPSRHTQPSLVSDSLRTSSKGERAPEQSSTLTYDPTHTPGGLSRPNIIIEASPRAQPTVQPKPPFVPPSHPDVQVERLASRSGSASGPLDRSARRRSSRSVSLPDYVPAEPAESTNSSLEIISGPSILAPPKNPPPAPQAPGKTKKPEQPAKPAKPAQLSQPERSIQIAQPSTAQPGGTKPTPAPVPPQPADAAPTPGPGVTDASRAQSHSGSHGSTFDAISTSTPQPASATTSLGPLTSLDVSSIKESSSSSDTDPPRAPAALPPRPSGLLVPDDGASGHTRTISMDAPAPSISRTPREADAYGRGGFDNLPQSTDKAHSRRPSGVARTSGASLTATGDMFVSDVPSVNSWSDSGSPIVFVDGPGLRGGPSASDGLASSSDTQRGATPHDSFSTSTSSPSPRASPAEMARTPINDPVPPSGASPDQSVLTASGPSATGAPSLTLGLPDAASHARGDTEPVAGRSVSSDVRTVLERSTVSAHASGVSSLSLSSSASSSTSSSSDVNDSLEGSAPAAGAAPFFPPRADESPFKIVDVGPGVVPPLTVSPDPVLPGSSAMRSAPSASATATATASASASATVSAKGSRVSSHSSDSHFSNFSDFSVNDEAPGGGASGAGNTGGAPAVESDFLASLTSQISKMDSELESKGILTPRRKSVASDAPTPVGFAETVPNPAALEDDFLRDFDESDDFLLDDNFSDDLLGDGF